MKFSLIVNINGTGPMVTGHWLQNHVGTLETAIDKASATEKVNSHMIDVAVIEESSVQGIGYQVFFARRLDTRRV